MDNREKNFISAVVYVHNAEDRIGGFIKELIRFLEDNFENSEIICVNDFSSDSSADIIRGLSTEPNRMCISLVNMSYFHGLELAMKAGTDLSIGDFVLELDSTFMDYRPEAIMDVYTRVLEGFDIVSASPDRKEKFSSRIFYKVFDCFTPTNVMMQTETFRILSRRVINRVSNENKTVPYRKALYSTSGLKTDNIRYEVVKDKLKDMDADEKKYRTSLAIDSLILFTNLGYEFSKVMSLFMIFITVVVLVYTVVAFIISNPIEGWTSTILFLSVVFFGLFVILTIIIKYLQIIVELVFKRKNYSYDSIEKLTK